MIHSDKPPRVPNSDTLELLLFFLPIKRYWAILFYLEFLYCGRAFGDFL